MLAHPSFPWVVAWAVVQSLAKFKEFQVISVGMIKEWWLGANVLAMVEVRVKLLAGVKGLGMGGFLSPCMNEVYSDHDQDI